MLRSLSNVIGKCLSGPKSVLGVGIAREHIYTVQTVKTKQGWCVDKIKKVDLPFRMFDGVPTDEVCRVFSASINELCAEIKHSYIPVQVALPDPAVSLRVFELDSLPKTYKERLALIHWLFSKERHVAGQSIACCYQPLGTENGKYLLLALVTDQGWLDCIERAFRNAGLNSDVIDMAASYRFNQLYDHLSSAACDAVLVALDRDAWSISISDGQGRLRFVRAHWCDPTKNIDNNKYPAMISEIEQVVRAYVHALPQRNIKNIYITGNKYDVISLADRLDQHVEMKCVRLPGGVVSLSVPTISQTDMDEVGATLAAAILR